MKRIQRPALAILAATVWISVSEFVRNQFILHDFWREHYQQLGFQFPDEPVNGAIWGVWSLLFAIVIYILSTKFSLIGTTFLSWFIGFGLMWVVIGNLGVLPFGILPVAVPLSLFESFAATFIIKKIAPAADLV